MSIRQVAVLIGVLTILSIVTGKSEQNKVHSINRQDKNRYKDCSEVRKDGGYQKSGVYTLWYLWKNQTESYQIFCEHNLNGSFNVIQRRVDGRTSFTQGWKTYETGFGQMQGDYWVGLKKIYYLTSTGNTILTMHLQDWHGQNRNIRYNYFKLIDDINYGFDIAGAQGDIPDDMTYSSRMVFATVDRPDINHCAINQRAGWWFNYCSYAMPNGRYYIGGPYTPSGGFYDGIYWKDWEGFGYSLKYVDMTLSNM